MRTFTFHNAGLQGILKYTQENTLFRIPYEGEEATPKPTMWLVKDQGVYLMTSVKLNAKQIEKMDHVCYAYKHGPNTRIAGDDFIEEIEFDQELQKAVQDGYDLILKVTPKSITVIIRKPAAINNLN